MYGFTNQFAPVNDPYLFGDLDLTAIWAVLSAGWYITVPLLGWSSTLRKLNARPVVVYWSFLIAIGVICVAVSILKTLRSPYGFGLYWQGAAAICSSIPDDDPSKPPYQYRDQPYFSSPQAWVRYNCTTQCGSLSPNLIMRPRSQMVPAAQSEFVNWVQPSELYSKISMTELSLFVLPPVILQYVYTLWSDRRSPAEARNRVCAFLAGNNIGRCLRMRRRMAVVLAIFIYVHAMLMLIICPLLFFFNIFFNEWSLAYYPQDEPVAAVGQWSPVVSVILVVIGISLAQLHQHKLHFRRKIFRGVKRLLYSGRKSRSQTPSSWETSDNCREIFLSNNNIGMHHRSRHLIQSIISAFFDPFSRALGYSRREWQDFRWWIHDPIVLSLLRNTEEPVELESAAQAPTPPPNAQYVRLMRNEHV